MEPWKERVYATYADTAPNGSQAGMAAACERQLYLRRYRRFLPRDFSAPILDIGCGAGGFLEALQSAGYTCVEGVDLSASQVRAAAARGLTGVTHAPAVEYLRARPNRYATISAFSVLEHQTRPELFDLLDAIRDALRPGGCLIAVVPNAKGLFGAHVRFADITHEMSFTPMSVGQLCAVVGLEAPSVLEHGPIVHGAVSALRWTCWQAVRAGLLVARLAEGADWRWPVFTQDLVFVSRKASEASRQAGERRHQRSASLATALASPRSAGRHVLKASEESTQMHHSTAFKMSSEADTK
jgi:SAM-dependent methyltransferase